eukprot:4175368-Pyramimonas_sp.AAC.1
MDDWSNWSKWPTGGQNVLMIITLASISHSAQHVVPTVWPLDPIDRLPGMGYMQTTRPTSLIKGHAPILAGTPWSSFKADSKHAPRGTSQYRGVSFYKRLRVTESADLLQWAATSCRGLFRGHCLKALRGGVL